MFNLKQKKALIILTKAIALGLRTNDIENIEELIYYNEYGLAMDTIASQLFEYEVTVSADFYINFNVFVHELKIDFSKYKYLFNLIYDKENVPSEYYPLE